jgi:hypothetical protein
MPTIARPLNFADFAAGEFVNWGQWDFPIQIVHDDQPFWTDAGPNFHSVRLCDVLTPGHDTYIDRGSGLRRGFARSDRLVIARYHPQASAIHLHFDTPVKALGTCMSADGTLGQAFLAQIELEDPNTGMRFSCATPAVFSDVVGTAPFVGVQGDAGEVIEDAWLDVKSDDVQALGWVAMNQLWILP